MVSYHKSFEVLALFYFDYFLLKIFNGVNRIDFTFFSSIWHLSSFFLLTFLFIHYFLKFYNIENKNFKKCNNAHTYIAISLAVSLIGIIEALNERKFTICLFLDLRKAFNSINHVILLEKLKLYGICGKLYKFLKSYLSHRTHNI